MTLGWGELLLLSSVVLWVLYSRFSLSMLGHAHPVGGYGLTMIAGSVGLFLANFIAGFFGYELIQDFSFNLVMVALIYMNFFYRTICFTLAPWGKTFGGDYGRFASEPRSRIRDADHVHPR